MSAHLVPIKGKLLVASNDHNSPLQEHHPKTKPLSSTIAKDDMIPEELNRPGATARNGKDPIFFSNESYCRIPQIGINLGHRYKKKRGVLQVEGINCVLTWVL